MNFRIVIKQLGWLLGVLSAGILLVGIWAMVQAFQGDTAETAAVWGLMLTVAGGVALGGVMWWWGHGSVGEIGRREALLLVALSWFVAAGLAGLPFYIWHHIADSPIDPAFASFTNCYFESMSGLTTTGATVLSDIESIPRSLLLWRSATHWLGGLGIVVLFVAVLPMLGVGGKRLFRVESPGPTPEGVRPRIQEAARALWFIYLGLTVAEIIVLMLVGMGPFDAVCHTFATLATGGFSTKNASAAAFGPGIQIVLIVFMLLAGINFGLYHHLTKRRWKLFAEDRELRAYLLFIGVGVAVVVLSYHTFGAAVTGGGEMATEAARDYPGWSQAWLDSIFQVVSIQTTTGFCSADFDRWHFTAKAMLVLLMFVGGSAGSTGGGVKVIRIVMMGKILWAELEKVFRPNVVRPVKMGRLTIDADMKLATLSYVLVIILLFGIGTAGLMLFESAPNITITTAATATIATLNNIGPGLDAVGAVQNFGWFTAPSKWLMCILMALGRLEVFAILVLLDPRFWRAE